MSAAERSVPTIVAAGYTALDTVVFEGRITHHAGGTAANVAAILAWLGWDAHLAAVLGDDPAGRRVAIDLKRAGVHVDYLSHQPAAQTAQVIHEIADSSHRFLFRCPECGRRLPRSRPLPVAHATTLLEDIQTAAVFFFDRANPGTLALAEEFRGRDALVVFEPSVAAAGASMERAAKLAHIVKFSDDRLSVMWSALPRPASAQIQVVTRGAHGAVVRAGEKPWNESTAFAARVVDAGGAGDWTTAGLLYQLAGNRKFKKEALLGALRFGQALAALNCEWPGGRGLTAQREPEQVLADARHLARAAPRRRRHSVTRRRTRRRPDACDACLAPHGGTGLGAINSP